MGRFDKPKGIVKTSNLSLNVIPFKQEALYYTRMGTYYSSKNRLSKALLFLQKAIVIEPENPQNHYNLACLLSKANRLEEANQIFMHIVQNMDAELKECYFFMAINYGLMQKLSEARKYLLKYLHLHPEGEMAEEAEDLLFALEEDLIDYETGDRSLDALENEALLGLIGDMSASSFKERLMEDEDFAQTLRYGLFQGNDIIKEAIVRLMGTTNCEMAHKTLSEFIANPWIKERLRQVAVLELKKIAPPGLYRVFKEGVFQDVNLLKAAPPKPVWQTEWQQVLECTFTNMRKSAYYLDEFYEDVEAIWIDFINHSYPAVPRMDKLQTWAAGLEYCLSRFHFLDLTQKDLARAYGVSTASIRRKYNAINRLLKIEQKAYHNMLSFLSEKKGEDYQD